jgi:hypothetical protein
MRLQQVVRALLGAGWLVGCGSSSPPVDALPPEAPPPDAAAPDAPAADAPPFMHPPPDGPVEETGTYELMRVPADPALTRRLGPAGATLVGGDSGCTTDPAATGDRWCAFSRPGADAAHTELWVMNVTQAATGPVACDGTSPLCLRLSTTLYTGTSIWGPSHPTAHRFQGDTLIFHADGANGVGDVYSGPIWTWRPGWTAARAITGPHGFICTGDPLHPTVLCLDEPKIEATGTSPFDRPKLHEMDLVVGPVTDPAGGRLPVASHVVNAASDDAFRARFSPDGASLVFSSVATAGGPETVQVVPIATPGPPVTVASDAAEWEISNDGAKIYYLSGYDRARGDQATGVLTMADFPSGANAVAIQKLIRGFQKLGRGEDRGLLLSYEGAGQRTSYALLRDRTRPTEILLLGSEALGVQVASDIRHSLYFRDVRGSEFPSAFALSHDGGGACRLTSDYRAETYGAGFSESGKSIFWIEYGRNQSESEEGWSARPDTCGDKVKWGDYVAWYVLLGDQFAVFEGGDIGDTTTWLEYTPLGGDPLPPWAPATVVKEHPDPALGIFKTGAGTFLVFSVSTGPDAERGLFLHGPLKGR